MVLLVIFREFQYYSPTGLDI